MLVLLRSDPDRWWTVDAVAAALRMSSNSAAQALEALSVGNLLDVRLGEGLAYRFAPLSDDVARAVEELADMHFRSRDAILTAIASQRSALAARRIADAFRLSGKKPHE